MPPHPPCCDLLRHFVYSVSAQRPSDRLFAYVYGVVQERADAEHPGAGRDLPVFVMAPVLPGERVGLNIFEPRYRLMVLSLIHI